MVENEGPLAGPDIDVWRTIAKPSDDVVDALCLVAELWSDRCSIGFLRGKLDVCERYAMTPNQERRLARLRPLIVEALPFAVPTARHREDDGAREFFTVVAFDRCYPPGFHKGWS